MNKVFRAVGIAFALAGVSHLQAAEGKLTAGQVIEEIKTHVGVPWQSQTVDTVKAGDPNVEVTGIATTFAATMDVLERAARSGKNLIIAHEPTFYNHLDQTEALKNDPVFQAKERFIEQHKLVVFRFHDHWHRHKPDGILTGMIDALAWKNYQDKTTPQLFEHPSVTLDQLAQEVKSKLNIRTIRVVGERGMNVTGIAFLPGASGSDRQIEALERENVQVLVAGESREWETVEYVRDAATQGKKKAVILLGHVPSEEAGMKYCAEWLKTFLPGVPIEFIPAREPFWTPQ